MPLRQRKSVSFLWSCYLLFLVVAINTVCPAQCLEGSIICETFGTGSRGPLPQGQTNFLYRVPPCPADGEYNLTDTVPGCGGNGWHELRQDHTPNDVRGNMLVVNASYQPSEFYSQKATGLCPGITYEFSLWVLNLNRELKGGECDGYNLRNPIIAMRVEQADGTLITEVIQPAVPRTTSPVWVSLSMQFVIQTNSNDVVIKLINKGLGGCGNDLVIDDIAFRPVHPTLTIQFVDSPDSELTVCADTRLTLSIGKAVGYPNPVYLWQQSRDNINWTPAPGAGQATYTINPVLAGRTYYRLRNAQPINVAAVGRAQCSAESNVLIVNGRPDAPFSLGDDITFCEDASHTFQIPNALPQGTTFVWSDQSSSRQLTVSQSGTYWLETNLNGCTYRDSVEALTQNCHPEDIYVPEAFSPNNDTVNDKLVIFHSGTFIDYTFQVFDRWGSVIFLSRQPDLHWDGMYQNYPCSEGMYAWTIQYTIASPLNKDNHFARNGQVMLIR